MKFTILNAEPVVLFISITYGIFMAVMPLFIFWTRCVQIFGGFKNLTIATEFCSQISSAEATDFLNVVQRDISEISPYIQICGTLTTLISAPIMGAWSDFHGRKKPLLISVTALGGYTALQMATIYFYDRWNVYYLLFAAEVFVGCSGGVAMASIVTSAIVVDDSRCQLELSGIPWRIALMCLCRCVGNILGTLVYSLCAIGLEEYHILHVQGFLRAYAIGFLGCVASLVYAILFVKETQTNYVNESGGIIKLSKSYLENCFRVLTTKRIHRSRTCLHLLIGIMFIDFVNLDNSLQLLYFKRPPFSWKDELFSKYLAMKSFFMSVGVFVLPMTLNLFSCRGKESLLLMVAISANCINFVVTGTTSSTPAIFIAGGLFFFGSSTIPAYNTLLSKMVRKDETARLFSAISILLVLSPLFSKTFLYQIYRLSLSTYSGVVFLVIAALLFTTLLAQIVVHYLMYPLWIKLAENVAIATEPETTK